MSQLLELSLSGQVDQLPCFVVPIETHPALTAIAIVIPPSCQGDQEAVAQVLSRHPYYLSYRLERIVTRGEYLRSLDRLPAESPTGWLSCTGERETN